MDQNKYIEVRIFEPVAETPTFHAAHKYSIKTLSTIHECDSLKVTHSYVQNNNSYMQRNVPYSTNLKSNIRSFPSSKQRVDSFRNADRPFDIDLLLRYYACNSDMEKSINKVFGKMNDQVCKDIDHVGPLIELGAIYKICNSLEESSPKNSLSSMSRFRDIIVKLRSLIRRCSNETLGEILSNDPSMKICEHCGVISCTKPANISVESRTSPPNTSYFLSTQMFSDVTSSGDDDPRTYRQIRRINPKKEQRTKRVEKYRSMQKNENRSTCKEQVDNGKIYGSREVNLTVKRENNFHINAPQRIETMVAEREHDNTIQETRSVGNAINTRILETSKTELPDRVKNSQMEKPSAIKKIVKATTRNQLQAETNCNFEEKDKIKNDLTVDFTNNSLHGRYFNPVDYKEKSVPRNKLNDWQTSDKDQLNFNECNEKVLRDILYEHPKSRIDDSVSQNYTSLNSRQSTESKQNQPNNVMNDITSSANEVTYLARECPESIEGRKKELVSQLDERTYVHSRQPINRRSFVLHNARNYDPCLNSEFLILDKLMASNMIERNSEKSPRISCIDSQKHLKHPKRVDPIRNMKQFRSLTCLIEDDSLENCITASRMLVQANESNTTVVSSSSAENMIREWVKVPQSANCIQDETYKNSDTSKPSTIVLNVEPRAFWANEKSIYCTETSIDGQRNPEDYNAKKTYKSSSKNKTKHHHSDKRTISNIISGSFKLWNSRDSIKDKINTSKHTDIHGSEKRLRKHLFDSFKSLKSIRSMKSKELRGSTKSSGSFGNSLFPNIPPSITRRIIYDESSLKNLIHDDRRYANNTKDILLLYRKVLESTEEMDWQSFQRFVEDLHPNKKNLWRDICKVINSKVKRITDEDDGSAEICIEITSTPFEEAKHERRKCSNEIVFEMDITLADVERCLSRRQLLSTEKEQLDTLKRASEVIKVRNDDVCDIEVASNQAE